MTRATDPFDTYLLRVISMRMTKRALQLEALVRIVLARLKACSPPATNFDPATTKLTFRVGTPDFLAPPLMASLVTHRAADLQRDAARRGRVPHGCPASGTRGDGALLPKSFAVQ